MDLLQKQQCKKGMKVWLVNPNSRYDINASNPLKGSLYECKGIITAVNDTISVTWENRTNNCYQDNELVLVNDTNEYLSIWENL